MKCRETLNPGIYIHVPFCVKKCAYCSFYSVGDKALTERYVDAVVREIGLLDSCGLTYDTLYFGGGTPSILSPRQMERILDAAYGRFSFLPDTEITVEANPGTVNPGKLAAYRSLGIGRLNFGIQSFDEEILKFLGRIHSREEALSALTWARQAGFENIGLDVIYGIPGQGRARVTADLDAAVAFHPEHISAYLLSIEEGTGLYQRLLKGAFAPLFSHQKAA